MDWVVFRRRSHRTAHTHTQTRHLPHSRFVSGQQRPDSLARSSQRDMAPGTSSTECPLLKKLPPVRRTGDDMKDETTKLQRQAFEECDEVLWNSPELAFACSKWLQGHLKNDAEKGDYEEDLFAQAPATIGHVEEKWLCAYLRDAFAIPEVVLGSMKAYDGEAPRQLFLSRLHVASGLKCPKECQDKLVLRAAVDARVKMAEGLPAISVGEGDTATINSRTGAIDWARLGRFGVVFNERGRGTNTVHLPSGHQALLDDDLALSREWSLVHNWSDTKAILMKSAARKYKCADFFPRQRGAHASPAWSGANAQWQALVGEATTRVQKQRSAASEGTVESLGMQFEDAQKEKHLQATKRAREALRAKQDERESKRRVSLGSVRVPAATVAAEAPPA